MAWRNATVVVPTLRSSISTLAISTAFQFATKLRRSDRSDRCTRLIMFGDSALRERAALRDCGVDKFLAKPAMPDGLVNALTAVTRHGRDFIDTADYFGPDRRG